jgi:hypothetical protein
MTHTDPFDEEPTTLTDPETLADVDGVAVDEETTTLPDAHFEHWQGTAGLVGVGVTTADGELLLWDGPHGWTLPYVEVGPGEDFGAAAREAVEALTGTTPILAGVARATRTTYRLGDGDDSLTRHQVVFRTDPVDAGTAAEMTAGEAAVRWAAEFDEAEIAADDAEDVGDEVDDVRLFLD